MKPTNSPTQGQLNQKKNRSSVAFGPLFPTANDVSWVGIGLYRKQTTRNLTQPNSPQTYYPHQKNCTHVSGTNLLDFKVGGTFYVTPAIQLHPRLFQVLNTI